MTVSWTWQVALACDAFTDVMVPFGIVKVPVSGDMVPLGPLMQYCIEQFGPRRCMFESNFPVDKVSYSYNVLYNAFKRLSQGYSPAERAALFHDTAARVYRLAV